MLNNTTSKGKIKTFFSKLTFRQKFMHSLIGATGLMVILLGAILYYFSSKTIENNYRETHESYMELFSASLNIRFEEIINSARGLLSDYEYMNCMSDNVGSSSYFSTDSQSIIEKKLLAIEGNNKYIAGILAVNESGKFRYIGTKGISLKVNEYYKTGDILDSDWVKTADDAEGKEVIIGFNVLDYSDETMMSVVKKMNDPRTMKSVGYLVVSVPKNMVRETFGTHITILENNRYLIVDDMLPIDDPHYVIYSENIDSIELNEIIRDHVSGNTSKYLFGDYSEPTSGWEIISTTYVKDLRKQSEYIKWITIVGIILAIIISLPLAGFLSRQINQPLALLEKTIAEVGEGNYRPDVEFGDDEIGRVGNYLLNISGNNLELREKLLHSELNEREAELLLLQSQINPHFLYNTLDAIYFMAVIDQVDDIAEMVKALSDMFRLSLNEGDKLTTVEACLDKIRAYMKIENLRYQNRFELVIDVATEMLDKKILTFLLQPIVENALTHGLERKIGPGSIVIIGYLEEDEMHITIHDNGIGIDDMSKLEKGYGIRNIRERIKLFYGNEYDLIIESEPDKGTNVFFTLPANVQEKGGNIEEISDN